MAGLLNTLKKNWRGLLDEVQAAPESLRALTQPAAAQQFDAALRNGGTIDKEKAVQMAMDVLQTTPMGVMGKIVYHGSPHKFDKFDMSRIGTGEGVQAYGHGLYMAERPGVAESYKNTQLQSDIARSGAETSWRSYLGDELVNSSDNLKFPSPAMKKAFNTLHDFDNDYDFAIKFLGDNLDAVNIIKRAKAKNAKAIVESGNLYKVDIPDESIPRMLDWDKPLSEQPEGVINAISQIKKQRGGSDRYWLDKFGENPTGSMIVNELRLIGGGSFEKSLKDQGIPGIRYLDGMSRNAGQGSSNYVLFDDKLPRILERNGIPTGLNPWAPGEWRGLLEP